MAVRIKLGVVRISSASHFGQAGRHSSPQHGVIKQATPRPNPASFAHEIYAPGAYAVCLKGCIYRWIIKTKAVSATVDDFAGDWPILIQDGSANKKRLHLHANRYSISSPPVPLCRILNQKVKLATVSSTRVHRTSVRALPGTNSAAAAHKMVKDLYGNGEHGRSA
ncbi:hypothetical protein FQR65_LT20216 [Abscondita terminalis]|nr:hypothetical protein FQR65_LT20216 [Abscondita terminalis]